MDTKIYDFIDSETLILRNGWEKKLDNLMQDEKIKSPVAFMPVRPDWNEPRKLWGYYNPLTGLFYPTDALNVLLNAYRDFVTNRDTDHKYFIILDEMNLARVEYYMSDLLSLMENMCRVTDDKVGKVSIGETAMVHPLTRCVLSKLPDKDIDKWQKYIEKRGEEIRWKIEGEKLCMESCNNCIYQSLKENSRVQESKNNNKDFIEAFSPIPPRIAYPENLVIIGTVNVDETTFSFAPKVLDRAFVCEFNEVYVDEYCKEYGIKNKHLNKFVKTLQDILRPATLHFGYRVINEMWDYLKTSQGSDDAFDFLLKSKVLPKIHGTGEVVKDILLKLFGYCININENGEKEKSEELEKKIELQVEDRYQESAKKIQEMYRRMKATGYCSYF